MALSVIQLSCNQETKEYRQEIILTNTSDVTVTDKPIKLKRAELKIPEGNYFPVIIGPAGDTIPSQLDDLNGDQQWDELFFVVNLLAGRTEMFQLSWTDMEPLFKKRTSIRFGVRANQESVVKPALIDTFYANQLPAVIGYQRYQTDGPTWENDKVGFRIYLDGRNSIDVFGKTKPGITPEDVGIGKDGTTEYNYADMLPWGTDILGVGNSVGLGGYALMWNDSLARLGITEQDTINNVDTTLCRIITEGPARSILKFDYINWKPFGRNYAVQTITSIWPGMYAFKNSVQFNHLTGDETMVVGLVNSKTDQPLKELVVNDKWVVLLTHDKQTVNKDGWLGMALLLPKDVYLGYMEAPKTGSLATTYLGKLKVENNKPVNYYAVAGWELTDEGFRNPDYFSNYVTDLVKELTAEIKVLVK